MDYANLIATPISAANPCGENLEDDNLFYNFLMSSEGTQESYDGKNIIPAEPPDWRQTKKASLEFLKSTKDLKLVVVLTHSVLNTEGLLGFLSCLKGIATLLEDQWLGLYPLLDADADNGFDKTMERISALSSLIHQNFVIDALRNTPLVVNKQLGPFSVKKILASTNSIDSAKPEFDQQQITAIFQDEDQTKLLVLRNAVAECQNYLLDIQNTFHKFEPQSGQVNFEPLQKTLASMHSTICKYGNLADSPVEEAAVVTPEANEEADHGASEPKSSVRGTNSVQSYSTEIRNRQDVEQSIDRICDYFKKYEPSSPVPVLLMRAKKLINLNFFDIIKEIAPESLETIHKLGGISDDSGDNDDN